MIDKLNSLREQLYSNYTKLAVKDVMYKLEKERQEKELISLHDEINFLESQLYFVENNFPNEESYQEIREEL